MELSEFVNSLNVRDAYFAYAYFTARVSHVLPQADWERILEETKAATAQQQKENENGNQKTD